MKKMMMAAVAIGMTGILASCNTGSAPDGSAKGSIDNVRTEYRLNTGTGQFIGCDNVVGNTNGRNRSTQVAVKFTLQGVIRDVTIGLKGQNKSDFDSNYTATVSGADLAKLGDGAYKVIFNANSQDGAFLPQSIVVTPTNVKVKVVTASNNVGSFYPQLVVTTGTSNFTINNRVLGDVPVYSNCTITATTNEDV